MEMDVGVIAGRLHVFCLNCIPFAPLSQSTLSKEMYSIQIQSQLKQRGYQIQL